MSTSKTAVDFDIKLLDSSTLKTGKTKASKCEAGIEYVKWMWYPTCPFCGLEDPGKETTERPDEIHMLRCTKRPLMQIPLVEVQVGVKDGKAILEKQPIQGSFVGQALQAQVRYPFRRLLKLPERDKRGRLTGEFFFYCEYVWKCTVAPHYVWSRRGTWVPWYEFSKDKPLPPKPEQTESEQAWLRMFMRQP